MENAEAAAASGRAAGRRVAVIARRPSAHYARALYADLRAADDAGAELILAESADDDGLGRAINDRLARAAAFR